MSDRVGRVEFYPLSGVLRATSPLVFRRNSKACKKTANCAQCVIRRTLHSTVINVNSYKSVNNDTVYVAALFGFFWLSFSCLPLLSLP